MTKISVSLVYHGMGDYFGGWGTEPGKSALLYAMYGARSTWKDIFDSACDELWNGCAGEDLPEDVTEEMVREELIGLLNAEGRRTYDADEICEIAADYAVCNDIDISDDADEDDDDDDWDDCYESPVCIFLVEVEDEDE